MKVALDQFGLRYYYIEQQVLLGFLDQLALLALLALLA